MNKMCIVVMLSGAMLAPAISSVSGQEAEMQTASKLKCLFFPRDGNTVSLTVPINLTSKPSETIDRSIPVGNFLARLLAHGGDGGEPGDVYLIITKGTTVVYQTTWQANDFIRYEGQSSGIQALNNDTPTSPHSAELQFTCNTD